MTKIPEKNEEKALKILKAQNFQNSYQKNV